MIKGYYVRIAGYLSEHVLNPDGEPILPEIIEMKDAIRYLMTVQGLTKEQIKAEALRDHDVIIREDFFPEERAT